MDRQSLSECNGCVSRKLQLEGLGKFMEMKFAAIGKQLEKLEIKFDALETTLTAMHAKIISNLEEISIDLRVPQKKFPLKNEIEIQELDENIRETPTIYIETFRRMLGPEGLEKKLELLFTRELMIKMIYEVGSEKIGLEGFSNLNKALFEAFRTEGCNFRDYKKRVRKAFGNAEKREDKTNSKAKKLKMDNTTK